jgi:hypothetical protein
MASGNLEVRNKRKNKRKENKKYPYKKGGGKRSMNINTK